jgi:hypothetical protein
MPYHVLSGVEIGMRLGTQVKTLRASKETMPAYKREALDKLDGWNWRPPHSENSNL